MNDITCLEEVANKMNVVFVFVLVFFRCGPMLTRQMNRLLPLYRGHRWMIISCTDVTWHTSSSLEDDRPTRFEWLWWWEAALCTGSADGARPHDPHGRPRPAARRSWSLGQPHHHALQCVADQNHHRPSSGGRPSDPIRRAPVPLCGGWLAWGAREHRHCDKHGAHAGLLQSDQSPSAATGAVSPRAVALSELHHIGPLPPMDAGGRP